MWGFLVTLYVRFTSLEQPLSRLSYLLKIYFSELVWGCEVLIHESMLFFFFFPSLSYFDMAIRNGLARPSV